MPRTSRAACARLPASCSASLAGGASARASGVNAAMSSAVSPRQISRSARASVASEASAASGTISIESICSSRRYTRKLAKFEIAHIGKALKRSNCCRSCGSRYRAGSPGFVGAFSSMNARAGCPALLSAMSGLPIPGVANSGTTMSSFAKISGSKNSRRRWNAGARACSRLLGPALRTSRMRRA